MNEFLLSQNLLALRLCSVVSQKNVYVLIKAQYSLKLNDLIKSHLVNCDGEVFGYQISFFEDSVWSRLCELLVNHTIVRDTETT
jgi:hypothetical protein